MIVVDVNYCSQPETVMCWIGWVLSIISRWIL
ncbi:hypothetical protein Pint_21699 [Pistacia integerrima]|uniref:Uncharacterized protein n=1 Tax=Pistacia integerrima TaxID=434235 RepID=A0ACC0XEY3_9ROSI|nr:hypothetical protein Pint_21699 [Pistacia integerrima]